MKLTLFSILMLLTLSVSAQYRQYYIGSDISVDSIFALDDNCATIAIEARCAMPAAKEGFGDGDTWWGIAWNYVSPDDYNYVIMRPFNSDFGALDDRRLMSVEYGAITGGNNLVTNKETVASGLNMAKGFNSMLLEWEGDVMRVFIGAKGLHKIMEATSKLPAGSQCKLVSEGSPLDIASLVVECGEDIAQSLVTGYEMDDVMRHLSLSGDPVEGIWRYLDRETDDNRARLGGNYSLIVVANGDGYDMLYLDGARVNNQAWRKLMLKGKLLPTPFENHYDMVWYDSMMNRMDDETHATFSKEGILSLEFPLFRSSMRFYRSSGINL